MFFECAYKRLQKKSGVLTFITPRFYLVNKDDYNMRLFFLNSTFVHLLATCNPFDSAVTENVITMLSKGAAQSEIPAYEYNEETCMLIGYIQLMLIIVKVINYQK